MENKTKLQNLRNKIYQLLNSTKNSIDKTLYGKLFDLTQNYTRAIKGDFSKWENAISFLENIKSHKPSQKIRNNEYKEQVEEINTRSEKDNFIKNLSDYPNIEFSSFTSWSWAKVEFNLPKPSTDISIVELWIKNYLSSKQNVLKNKVVNLMIYFSEVSAFYSSGEFVFNNVNESMEHIKETAIQNWQFMRMNYEKENWWHVNKIGIYARFLKGGCEKSISILGFSTRDLIPKIFNPVMVKNNNCAIGCFLYEGKNTDILSMNTKAMNIKKLLFPKKKENDMISFDELNILCDYFKKGVNVYSINEGKFNKIFSSIKNENIDLLNYGEHYVRVIKDNLFKFEFCNNCHKFISDMETHKLKCKKCKKCGHSYINVHTEEDCKFNQSQIGVDIKGKIKCSRADKIYKADKNIIYADFETINEGKLSVYAVGYSKDDEEPNILYGKDSLDKFIDYLLKLKQKFTLVFYNGGRFDLYFVYKRLIERGIDCKKIIYSDGCYKTFTFNKISTFDLCLHMPGSLKNNCKAFGVADDKSKGDFDHKKIQSWDDVEKFRNEWQPYLRLDIISMRELYLKYSKSVYDEFKVNVNKFITLSSLAYNIWRQTIGENDIINLPYDIDLFVRRSIFGGRCYPQKQYFESEGDEDYLLDIDVVSLYPTAMSKNEYPIGEYRDFTNENQLEDLRLRLINNNFRGFDYKWFIAECDILPNKDLVSAVLPRRSIKGLHWDLCNIQKGVYNLVDLQRAVKHGYKIEKIHRAVAWKKSDFIFKEYIDRVFEIKKNAVKDTPQYSIAKLLMNSLYGKMLQSPVVEKNMVISNISQLDKLQINNKIIEFRPLNDEKAIVYYQPVELDETVNKPSFLGSFILGYSREIMDKYINAINGYHNIDSSFYRTDTDSLIIHSSQLPNVQKYIGKNLGDIDFDIKGKITKFVEVCPKVYICDSIKHKYSYVNNKIYVDIGFNYCMDGEMKIDEIKNDKPIFTQEEQKALKNGEFVVHNKKHIRAKGFSSEEQKLLNFDDFKNMLFHNQREKETTQLKDNYGNNKGVIIRENDKIVLKLDDKLKKIGFNVNSKQEQFGFSSVISQRFERTLNKTSWEKRIRIPNHPNLASLPLKD
jgi:hypothetical protein